MALCLDEAAQFRGVRKVNDAWRCAFPFENKSFCGAPETSADPARREPRRGEPLPDSPLVVPGFSIL